MVDKLKLYTAEMVETKIALGCIIMVAQNNRTREALQEKVDYSGMK